MRQRCGWREAFFIDLTQERILTWIKKKQVDQQPNPVFWCLKGKRTRMRLSLHSFLLLTVLFSCNENDGPMTSSGAVDAACAKCHLNAFQMQWLSERIQEAQEKPEKNGNFYLISTSEGIVIVHQPAIMSCLGCLRFNCIGGTPTLSASVIEHELVPGMNSDNLIYSMGI